MSDRLFDPKPYSKPHAKPRDERAKAKRVPPPVVEVVVGDVWKILAGRRGCHAVKPGTGNLTYCDIRSALLTVPAGTKAAACQKCITAGAPYAGSGAA